MTELLEAPMAAAEACAPGGGTISMEQAERVALVVKALADPVRLRILHHIAATPGEPAHKPGQNIRFAGALIA